MALKLQTQLDNGLVAPDSYHRVSSATFYKNTFQVHVAIFATAESASTGIVPIDTKLYVCEANSPMADKYLRGIAAESGDVIARAYFYLKTLDIYSNALDV